MMKTKFNFTTQVLLKPLGFFFIGCGIIGMILPIMPTTVFFILASMCFAKSSEKWREWIHSLPQIGPAVKNWEQFGVISIHGKWFSTGGILATYPITYLAAPQPWPLIVLLIEILVILYIWSRPSMIPVPVENSSHLKAK